MACMFYKATNSIAILRALDGISYILMTTTRENLDYGMKIINPIAQNILIKKLKILK